MKRQLTTTEVESFTLEPADIEAILYAHFVEKGWEMDFEWIVGRGVSLDVKRTREFTTVINPLP